MDPNLSSSSSAGAVSTNVADFARKLREFCSPFQKPLAIKSRDYACLNIILDLSDKDLVAQAMNDLAATIAQKIDKFAEIRLIYSTLDHTKSVILDISNIALEFDAWKQQVSPSNYREILHFLAQQTPHNSDGNLQRRVSVLYITDSQIEYSDDYIQLLSSLERVCASVHVRSVGAAADFDTLKALLRLTISGSTRGSYQHFNDVSILVPSLRHVLQSCMCVGTCRTLAEFSGVSAQDNTLLSCYYHMNMRDEYLTTITDFILYPERVDTGKQLQKIADLERYMQSVSGSPVTCLGVFSWGSDLEETALLTIVNQCSDLARHLKTMITDRSIDVLRKSISDCFATVLAGEYYERALLDVVMPGIVPSTAIFALKRPLFPLPTNIVYNKESLEFFKERCNSWGTLMNNGGALLLLFQFTYLPRGAAITRSIKIEDLGDFFSAENAIWSDRSTSAWEFNSRCSWDGSYYEVENEENDALLQGKKSGYLPLYITEYHWNVSKLMVLPLLARTFTGDAMNVSETHISRVLLLALFWYLEAPIDKLREERRIKLLFQILRTCYALEEELPGCISFVPEDYHAGPQHRTLEFVPSHRLLLASLLLSPHKYDLRQLVLQIVAEETRRAMQNLVKDLDQAAVVALINTHRSEGSLESLLNKIGKSLFPIYRFVLMHQWILRTHDGNVKSFCTQLDEQGGLPSREQITLFQNLVIPAESSEGPTVSFANMMSLFNESNVLQSQIDALIVQSCLLGFETCASFSNLEPLINMADAQSIMDMYITKYS